MLPAFEQVAALFHDCGVDVSRETYEMMEVYAAFLVAYNEKVNLTAVTEGNEILRKHFLDSMLLAVKCGSYLPEGGAVLDIGSGAGFPGVPLCIVRPDLDITLLDSLNKRIVFLDALREKLGITYRTIHGRAEELARKQEYRERFDAVTARAVAAMPVLAEYSLPFVKQNGYWMAMKGPNEEIRPALQGIRMLGGHSEEDVRYSLPGGDERVIFVVKKCSPTPTKYPRNSGQIRQKPL
ncbi:MAG: 16S rRNA (guanine(527)-N(7))-methyltransferase RsmG [Oscillospiraceae bacterium]|nr:16S rRNA (guanine(527)-N(7))-methyltransferase RsmG [Oscillospiraceae bacterium]